MLTNQDISKLVRAMVAIFPTRDEAVFKSDLAEVRADVSSLRAAVDNYAKRTEIYHDEVKILNYRVTKLENQ